MHGMKHYITIFITAFIFLIGEVAEAQTFPANIPNSRPRVWWDSQRLAQAQQWFTTHPFSPSTSTDPVESASDPVGNALRYILTGNTTNARVAINWAMNAISTMPTSGLTCDQCRWYGEQAIIAYDWCYNEMTPAERDTFLSKMNNVVTAFNVAPWGNDNPESNYFWGYQRLSLLWGIASYWENTTKASGFINNALQTKWTDMFLPHANTKATGGIPSEGVDYGGTVESYPVVPLETMRIYGRDMYAETEYFKRAVFANIYSTLPDVTYDNPLRSTAGKSWFPYGDSGDFLGAPDPVLRSSVKEFMKYAAVRWKDVKIGKYARQWVNSLNATFPRLYDAADPGGAVEDFTSLPLDYYSTGEVGHAFLRTQWGPQATVAHLQLSSPPLIGHEHFDAGNWQLWRNKYWLSRESPGRGQGSGYSYAGYNNVGRVDAEASVNHNVLLFGGKGHAASKSVEPAQVLRMETKSDYFYCAVDVTPAYINTEDNAKWGNVNIAHAEREFIFIRPLETLFIFDRVESNAGANTTKTFLTHFQNQPVLDGPQTYTSTNGNQVFRLQTLLPANLPSGSYRLINEQSSKSSETGNPFRLEVEMSGAGPQYFMHVAQARDLTASNLTASVADNGSTYTVTISHPSKGGAKIILNKGINTMGGSFGFSTSGVPAATAPLTTEKQTTTMTDDGPVWGNTSSCSYSIAPASASAAAGSSTGSFTVSAAQTCAWTAASDVSWLSIVSGSSGSGNGVVNYSVVANTGAARSGTITAAGQTFTVNQAAASSNCVVTSSPGTWTNSSFPAQTAAFTVNFDVTPSQANMDGVVGISNGSQGAYSGFACLVQFGASGFINARNGGAYAAATSIPYMAGNSYHIREVINVTNHTYSVYVTPPGGSEQSLGVDYNFRTEQNSVTQLNNWGATTDPSVGTGTLAICNFTFEPIGSNGGQVDYYVNETEPTVSFTGGLASATIAAEGLAGSNCLKFFNLAQWDKTKRVHYAVPKDISTVLATDKLRVSVDLTPASPPTYIVIAFNDRWDVTVNTPVIDNVAGFQTFDIDLSNVRTALGNTVNDIYFHAGDGFAPGATLKIDEIRFVRQSNARVSTPAEMDEETSFAKAINVYPNPAIAELKIELSDPVEKPASLVLLDRFGKTVTKAVLDPGTNFAVINVQGFTPGVYILQLQTSRGLIRKKIMISQRE